MTKEAFAQAQSTPLSGKYEDFENLCIGRFIKKNSLVQLQLETL